MGALLQTEDPQRALFPGQHYQDISNGYDIICLASMPFTGGWRAFGLWFLSHWGCSNAPRPQSIVGPLHFRMVIKVPLGSNLSG